MDVTISDPQVYVSQVQGPNALAVLADAAAGGMPDPFTYFGGAQVDFGGQSVWVTRTGYTNELGWEFYTEPHHDADALWTHLSQAGAPHGLQIFGLDSMNVRRIEGRYPECRVGFSMRRQRPMTSGLGRFVGYGQAGFYR